MVDIEIGIFVTSSLYAEGDYWENNGYYAAEVAKKYIEGALSKTSFSYDVDVASQTPDPPKEDIYDTQCEYSGICDSGNEECYNNLWHWWTDWTNASCVNPAYQDDVYLLLSNASGGGLGHGNHAVAGGFDLVSEPKTYQRFMFGGNATKIDTVLEEVGHCLIENMSNDDCDGVVAHDSGKVVQDSATGNYAISPQGLTDYKCSNAFNWQENNCGVPYDKDAVYTDSNGNIAGHVFEYSDCTVDHFTI